MSKAETRTNGDKHRKSKVVDKCDNFEEFVRPIAFPRKRIGSNALKARKTRAKPAQSEPTVRKKALKAKNQLLVPKFKFDPKTIRISDMPASKQEITDRKKGHQEEQRNVLGLIFALSWRMRRNPARYDEFKRSPFFEDFHRPPEEDEITKWVAYDQMDAVNGNVRDRACRYAEIAKRWLDEGLKPSQVEQRLLDEGKITGAYKLCAKSNTASTASSTDKTVELRKGEFKRIQPDGEVERETESQSLSQKAISTTTESLPKPRAAPRFNLKTDLLVTTESAVLAASRLRDGINTIKVEVTAQPETGWKHIRAINIEPDLD